MAPQTRFATAKAAFDKAGRKSKVITEMPPCDLGDHEPTEDGHAVLLIVQKEFRGTSVHITGQCEQGHTLEQYGYASEDVLKGQK